MSYRLFGYSRTCSRPAATLRTDTEKHILVSVLDLDNSVRFGRDTCDGLRKQPETCRPHEGCAPGGTKPRCTAYARAPNSVDLYLSKRCQCGPIDRLAAIRATSSDWTAKHCRVLSDLIGIW
jgi:hypothetical protein